MASRSDTTAAADAPVDSVATTLSGASFVRIRCSAAGDGLAAAGLLARALRRVDVPFQVRVASVRTDQPVDDDGLSVSVGFGQPGADLAVAPDDAPASLAAYRIAADIDGEAAPDSVIALAGVVADGGHPESAAGSLVETAEDAGRLCRRPGVATPVTDPVDGLAHSTLLHAPFSGDPDAVAGMLSSVSLPEDGDDPADDFDADTRRSIASCVALAVAGDGDAPPHAADAVERVLRPYATPGAPTATLGGFADVLTAVARERPGTGVALALGHGGRDAAVDAWREHGTAVHKALGSAPTERHDGVFAVRTRDLAADAVAGSPGRLATLARLARDFRSPEPLVVALGDGVAAISARESGANDAAAALAAEFPATDGTWTGDPERALARIDPDASAPELVAAIRGRSA